MGVGFIKRKPTTPQRQRNPNPRARTRRLWRSEIASTILVISAKTSAGERLKPPSLAHLREAVK